MSQNNKGLLSLLFVAAGVIGLWVFSPPSMGSSLVGGQVSEGPAEKFWVFDGHMHPTSAAYRRGGDIGSPQAEPRFTLSLARQGGLGAAFFNTSIDEFYEANFIAVKEVLRQIDHFYAQIALFPDQVGVATNAEEVRALRAQGKVAALLAIEGAIAIESDLGVLRMLHRLGLREMNLVHNLENNIGDVMYSQKNGGRGSGLTEYGRRLVAEMNRLGILIDLSHTAEQTIREVMEASSRPVATTHSGARALVNRPGNWSDDMIRQLASKGGVICVAFLPQQVSAEYDRKWHGGRARGSGIMGMDSLVYGGEPGTIYDFIRERRERGDGRRSEMAGRRRKDIPPLSALIDHIDHIVRLVGVDHVCISSDWGGYPVNIQGIENAGEYQNIARALLKRGYGRNEVAKVMGENLLRVFDQVTSIRN